MFLRKMKEKKLPNEEIVKYFCCYRWYGLIPRHFHYLTKKKKTDLQMVILEKWKKLRKIDQMNINYYLYPTIYTQKDYDSSICTFSFNRHIFV